MKAIDCAFTRIINGTTQFIIPVFQRDYRWEEQQCRQLWADVLRAAKSTSEQGHFIGSVVYISTGDNAAGFTRWLLIDGQQRLTTLTLLLTALRDHIKETNWTGGENDPTVNRIEAYFLLNVQEDGARRQKLILRRRDQETLAALIDGGDKPTNPSVRLLENYDLFRELLQASDPATIYAGVGKLVVVDVSLDRQHDNPQLVFESLNSTGVDLSQSDLIRNFILMRLPEADQTRLYNTYWSKVENVFRGSESSFDAFVRDYIALKTRAYKQEKADAIYLAFRDIWKQLTDESGSIETVLGELLRYARYHAAFSLGSFKEGPLLESLQQLHRLVDVPAILIMRLFDCHDRSGTLTEADFIQSLALLESYILRRAICRQQTRGYWQIFANIAYDIDEASPYSSLKVGLARQRDAYGFPSSETFNKALLNDDLYHLRVCRFVLDRLENFDTKEPSPTKDLSIEHVLPQNENLPISWKQMLGDNWSNVQKVWLHRLGNLTLTAYNSTYSDRPFEEKKAIEGGFSDSAVRLNKFVRDQSRWTETEIEQRGAQLAKRALEVWPLLIVDLAQLAKAKSNELRKLAAKGDIATLKMDDGASAILASLRSKISSLGDVIEVIEARSISYHAPEFFVEVLPRRNKLMLILALEFSEIEQPPTNAGDTADWKFFTNAKYSGGTYIRIASPSDMDAAMPLLQQSLQAAST
jgi:uncharacterized protein with ParB-like and HNH nuclease domain/predicted transport protein